MWMNKKRIVLMVEAIVLGAVSACGGGGGDEPASSPPLSTSFPMNVQAVEPPVYPCGTPDAGATAVINDLNRFWESSVRVCACQFDPVRCGRSSAFISSSNQSYVYYNAQQLALMQQVTGSRLPAESVIAHEFGHSIQLQHGLPVADAEPRELQADCLAGFYIGSKMYRGLATEADKESALAVACQTADPAEATNSHGVCAQRRAAMSRGIDGYLANGSPLQVCA